MHPLGALHCSCGPATIPAQLQASIHGSQGFQFAPSNAMCEVCSCNSAPRGLQLPECTRAT
eukprot:1060411-Pelagomonas_calceolata.AAC.1